MADAWRGEQWGQRTNLIGGARLMVLGDSHYSKDHPVGSEVPEMTRDVVLAYTRGELGPKGRFFTNIERLVTGTHGGGLSRGQTEAFWQSIVFYNYIPVIAATRPNSRPQPWMWEGETPSRFFEVVKRTEAEIILVCGRDLWRRKMKHVAISNAYSIEGREFEAHEINWSPEYGAVAAHILHPSGSRGWAFEGNRPVVDYLFEELARRRSQRGEEMLPDWRNQLKSI